MKLDQTTLLILAVAGVGAYFLFRRPRPGSSGFLATLQPTRLLSATQRPAGQWGQTYTDSKGRTVVEGVDAGGNPKSFITYNGGSK